MKKYNKIILIIFAISAIVTVGFVFFSRKDAQEAKAGWWNDFWSYRKAIVINHSYVAGDLENFPVLISLTDTSLGAHAQADGDDIIFISDNGQKLSHEIESFATSTGVLVAWVKIPNLSSGDDTVINMYYGNAGVGNQEDVGNVWDDNYRAVWHMDNTTDSSNKGVTLTANGGASVSGSGKMSSAYLIDGANENLSFSENNQIATAGTISFWYKETTAAAGYNNFFAASNNQYRFMIYRNNDDDVLMSGIGDDSYAYFGTVNVFDGSWRYVTFTWDDASNERKIFVNGSQQSSTDTTSFSIDPITTFRIGNEYDGGGQPINGLMDEFRISSVIRSDTWFETEFNNQNSPATFLSVQTEETGPGPVGYWSFDEGYGTTAHDESASGNDGTITGATWQDESMCVSGKCLYFDGSNDLVEINNESNFDNFDEITISAWVKNLETPGDHQIISKRSAWDSTGIPFEVQQSTDYAGDVFTWLIRGNANDLYGPIGEANKWYHVVTTWDGTTMFMYINGILSQTKTAGVSITDNNEKVTIGSLPGGGEYWKGYIDEVKIYFYARNADEIKQDYAAGLAGIKSNSGVAASFGSKSDSWMSDGLVGYWKFDEPTTAETYEDSSGNGNSGTAHDNASTTAGKYGNSFVGGGVGSSDRVLLDNTDIYDDLSEGTIAAWVKWDSNSSYDEIFGAGSAMEFEFAMSSNNKFEIWSRNTCDGGQLNAEVTVSNPSDWHHLVYTTNSAGNNMYVDGELQQPNYISGSAATNKFFRHCNTGVTHYQVGAVYNNILTPIEIFDGRIDEVRIYNRALSADEVKKLYDWAPGPVAWWRFDELSGSTVYDSAASSTYSGGNHGQFGGGDANPAWTQGKYGGALEFDGYDDEVNVGDITALNNASAFTFSAWLKQDVLNAKAGFLYKWVDSSNMIVGETWSDGHLFFQISNGIAWRDRRILNYSNYVKSNEWFYFSAVYDGHGATDNDKLKLFIDGISRGSNSGSPIPTTTSASLNSVDLLLGVGEIDGGSEVNWNGSIDDVRIYNYTRTQKQILENMANGPALQSPILNLKFDEGYGDTAYDSSVFKNNGTLNSGGSGANDSNTKMWNKNGKIGGAMEFDGNDSVSVTTDASLELPGSGTVAAWFKKSLSSGSDNAYLAGNCNWSTDRNGYCLVFYGNTLTGELASASNSQRLSTAKVYNDNQWHFGVFTWDGNELSLYVDGRHAVSSISQTLTPVYVNDLMVGKNSATDGYYFGGLIDDVRVYNYALSDDEIKTLYNQGAATVLGSVGSTAGSSDPAATSSNAASLAYCVPGSDDYCAPPVLELNFEEMGGGTNYDTSGSGNNGTLGGGTSAYRPEWERVGKVGHALRFDGNDDYTILSVNAYNSLSEGTISLWFKSESTGNDYGNMFAADGTSEPWLELGYERSSQRIYFGMEDGFCASDYYGFAPVPGNGNDWHQAVWTVDNGGNALYIDGVKSTPSYDRGDSSGTCFFADAFGIHSIYYAVGCDWRPSSCYLPEMYGGLIDQVKIYDYARTPAQIAWDYNGGAPIAHWTFDECSGGVIHDESGNGNDGQLYLGTTGVAATGTCASSSDSFWYNGREGKYNSAGSFDGVSDYVKISNNTNLDLQAPLSVSVWVNPDDNDADLFTHGKQDASPFLEYQLMLLDTDDRVRWSVSTGGVLKNLDSKSVYTTGRWMHIIGTWDGATMKLYINGVLDNETAKSGTIGELNQDSYIGGWTDYERLTGKLDDVKVYNYALTPEQVKTEYNGGAVKFGY